MADNIDIVRDLYAAFGRGDIEACYAGMAPDIDWRSVGDPEHWPAFGERQGIEAVKGYFAVLAEELDFNDFQVREIDACGDKVVAEGVSKVAFKQGGLPAEAEWAHIFTLKDGKIVRFREFMDTAMVRHTRAESWRRAKAGWVRRGD